MEEDDLMWSVVGLLAVLVSLAGTAISFVLMRLMLGGP